MDILSDGTGAVTIYGLIGDPCLDSRDCYMDSTTCLGGLCQCQTGYAPAANNLTCQGKFRKSTIYLSIETKKLASRNPNVILQSEPVQGRRNMRRTRWDVHLLLSSRIHGHVLPARRVQDLGQRGQLRRPLPRRDRHPRQRHQQDRDRADLQVLLRPGPPPLRSKGGLHRQQRLFVNQHHRRICGVQVRPRGRTPHFEIVSPDQAWPLAPPRRQALPPGRLLGSGWIGQSHRQSVGIVENAECRRSSLDWRH